MALCGPAFAEVNEPEGFVAGGRLKKSLDIKTSLP
jgi:hypothetical protein